MNDDNQVFSSEHQPKERLFSLWLAAAIILLSVALGVALGLTFPVNKIV